MADLFTPQTHVDGEILDKDDLNRLEQGTEAIDVAVDALTDRVDALYAAGGAGGGAGQVVSGPRVNFAPAMGTVLLDTSLIVPRYIGGYGTEWRELDGSAIVDNGTPAGGTSTAPVLSSTVTAGGTIGAINLSWTDVPGRTDFIVKETESPNGVSGMPVTTTSSVRTPSTARNYDFWVVSRTNGVESAASNHITATLPFTGSGGTPPASNPSTFLNINGLGNGTGGWWNLGVGYAAGHQDIAPSALNTFVDSPYYTMNADGTAVQFQVFMNGGKTSTNTKYPRCELREYATGSTSTKAAWNAATGRHIMRGRTKIMHYAPIKCEAVVAQIHDETNDNLQILAQASSATGSQSWLLKINGTTVDTLVSGVTLGQETFWSIDLNNNVLTVQINGVTQYSASSVYTSKSTYYFKVGNYPQQNSTDQANASTEYSRVELRDLFVSHS